ncbi:MAG: hypothetical protein ACKVT2_08705 [Saprospiraceae bacterium]
MKRVLLLTIGATFFLTLAKAQISPWEPVRGLNEEILAMGHSATQLRAATRSGLFSSNDNGILWTLEERINLSANNHFPIWMLDSVAVAILPKIVLNLNPELYYVLYRSVAGADFVEGNWSFDPAGAWGATTTVQSFYAADDSTLCIALRRAFGTGGDPQMTLYISKNAGQTWLASVSLGVFERKKCIANSGDGYWMTNTFPADSIFKYCTDGSTLIASAKVPSGGSQITGGFYLADTLSLVSSSGRYNSTTDDGNTWKSGILPFDTVGNFWREKGILYLRNPNGLYRSRHLWDTVWDTIYEKGISGMEGAEGIFRAGNSFFKKTNDFCPQTFRKSSGQSYAQWKPIQPVGLDPAAGPNSTAVQNDSLFFRYNNCTFQEGCGGIFRPTSPRPPQPGSFKHLSARFFIVPQNAAYAMLRTLNNGAHWDTVLYNINFSGSFVSAGTRLYYYSLNKVIYSDDLGSNWIETNWVADQLLSNGIDTLVRQLGPNQSFVSFDSGNNWLKINNLPVPGYLRLYQNKLALMVDKKVWVSTDWGMNWPLTKEIFYPGTVFRTWADKGVYIIDLHRTTYPICENISVGSTDGGLHWSSWPSPFRSNGNCSGALLPGTHAATGYLLYNDWLYANTDLSGLWRARRPLLDSNTTAWPIDTLCTNQVAIFYSDTLTQSGFYEKMVPSLSGCDSIARLQLLITPEKRTNWKASICYGDTLFWNGEPYFSTGYHTQHFQAVAGCDSTAVLFLQLNGAYTILNPLVLCQGDTFTHNDLKYWHSGTYLQHFPVGTGCDSVVVISLTFLPTDTINYFNGICPGETFQFGNQILSQPGTYILFNPSNCVTTLQHLAQYNEATTELDSSLQLGAIFLGQTLTIDTVLFQMLETYQGCDSTIQWNVHVITSGVPDRLENIVWKIQPNPAHDQVFILLEPTPKPVQFRLLDVMGRACREWDFPVGQSFELDMRGIVSGCYCLEIQTREGRSGKRLILLK